jgi:DNA-binding IclR family transcriptional regulator
MQIGSVNELRALLLLSRDPQTEWSAETLASKLYFQPSLATAVLTRLVASGFLVASAESHRYRFQPHSSELEKIVAELDELDRKRPVTLINMIYAKPADIQAFADAFKIKKEKKEEN